jgi:transcription antitermination factor NusG
MEKKFWFAMGAPYMREQLAARELRQIGLEYYIPMSVVGYVSTPSGITKEYKPLIRNLIFVHATLREMLDFKKHHNELIHFICRPMDGKTQKICVPDKQMEDFMRVCDFSPESTQFITEEEIKQLRPNAKIRILDGDLKGTEGYYQQVKGHGKKKIFVVKIDFFGGCATTLTEVDKIRFETE